MNDTVVNSFSELQELALVVVIINAAHNCSAGVGFFKYRRVEFSGSDMLAALRVKLAPAHPRIVPGHLATLQLYRGLKFEAGSNSP